MDANHGIFLYVPFRNYPRLPWEPSPFLSSLLATKQWTLAFEGCSKSTAPGKLSWGINSNHVCASIRHPSILGRKRSIAFGVDTCDSATDYPLSISHNSLILGAAEVAQSAKRHNSPRKVSAWMAANWTVTLVKKKSKSVKLIVALTDYKVSIYRYSNLPIRP